MRKKQQKDEEICNECGRSVKFGSGSFVNRVPDGNTIKERKEMGRPFPKGGWICADCDERPGMVGYELKVEGEECQMEEFIDRVAKIAKRKQKEL